MKFLVLSLALIGAASAGYIAPLATGYDGFNTLAAPNVVAYNTPVLAATPISPIVKNIVAAPSVTSYAAPLAYNTPIVTATPVSLVAKSFVAAAPAFSSYSALPAISTYAAPAISAYAAASPYNTYAAPAFNAYGAQAIYGNGNAFGYDLWKKKKAAAH